MLPSWRAAIKSYNSPTEEWLERDGPALCKAEPIGPAKGEYKVLLEPLPAAFLSDIPRCRNLSKEDEAAVGKGDLDVRREDQDKINKFSRLHQREMLLEEELREKALGDAFIMLPLPEVQAMLSSSTETIGNTISETQQKLTLIREEMEQLKVKLYARFGKSINLET
ncbi:MAG: hypothetical protein LQ342_006068 [Letrouitia transgressa]|nr:MAG: hypothetical protein LQ342_006068 [Letrouitia transgressa]